MRATYWGSVINFLPDSKEELLTFLPEYYMWCNACIVTVMQSALCSELVLPITWTIEVKRYPEEKRTDFHFTYEPNSLNPVIKY